MRSRVCPRLTRNNSQPFLSSTLLVEIYAPRNVDQQQPHTRDEVYFVASGSGEFVCGENRTSFNPTDILSQPQASLIASRISVMT
jgi:gentisate 1,2-dioxygenase